LRQIPKGKYPRYLPVLTFGQIFQVNTYYGKYPVNTLPGIYQVFTWVFTLGIYPGKYPESIYLKVFTFSLLSNLRNFTKFWEKSKQNG